MRAIVNVVPTAAVNAVVVWLSLVVLLALQFPFSGGLAVDSRPFEEGVPAQFVGRSR